MNSELLAELQWDDGFAIPVANEENKTLEDQVETAGQGGSLGAGGQVSFLDGRNTPILWFLSFPSLTPTPLCNAPPPRLLTLPPLSVLAKHYKLY